jgi:hypothetical protein
MRHSVSTMVSTGRELRAMVWCYSKSSVHRDCDSYKSAIEKNLHQQNMAASHDALLSAAALTTTLVVVRWIQKRANTPIVRARLQCACGKVQGVVVAIPQDSLQLYCYCQDCRDYAAFVAAQKPQPQPGCTKQDPTSTSSARNDCKSDDDDSTHIVQVCKSAVTLFQGADQLQLARKSPNAPGMHRFYAKCCCAPVFNTVQCLGFVGVLMDRLTYEDEKRQFSSPVSCYPEFSKTATETTTFAPLLSIPDALWKLIRYVPYTRAGPFDYNQEPVYWGGK